MTMRMKLGMMVMVLALAINGAACTRIGPGYTGIKVSMAGDNKGVDSTPAVTGWLEGGVHPDPEAQARTQRA